MNGWEQAMCIVTVIVYGIIVCLVVRHLTEKAKNTKR
jgi:hypothetical protein